MRTKSTISTTTFGFTVGLLSSLLAVGGYFLYEGHKLLRGQQVDLTSLSQELEATSRTLNESITANERAQRDLNTQLAAVRVAVQQSSNIRFDKAGAVITKKHQSTDDIELR